MSHECTGHMCIVCKQNERQEREERESQPDYSRRHNRGNVMEYSVVAPSVAPSGNGGYGIVAPSVAPRRCNSVRER